MNFFYKKIAAYLCSLSCRIDTLLNRGFISFGASLEIGSTANVSIGRNVRIMSGVYISIAENAHLVIEDNVWIGPGVVMYCEEEIVLGRGTRVAHYCSILDHNYEHANHVIDFNGKKESQPLWVGENVWIGANSLLLKGAGVGNNTLVGAGSFINKKIPANSMVYTKKDLLIKLQEQ